MVQKRNNQLANQIEQFVLDRQAQNISDNSIRWYRQGLSNFHSYCDVTGVTAIEQVEAGTVRKWLVSLQNDDHNSGGIYGLFSAVRAFIRWCVDEYEIDNPLKHIKAPKRTTPPQKVLSVDDFDLLLSSCGNGQSNSARDKAILLMLMDTGIRHDELSRLNVGDIDVKSGEVTIRKGKGGKGRIVYVGATTQKAIRSYMRRRPGAISTEAMWTKADGKRLTKDGIRQTLAYRAEKAGIKEPGLHEFRRAFAVNFLRNGGNLIALQRILGHASITMTEHYAKLLQDDIAEQHRKFGVVDNLK